MNLFIQRKNYVGSAFAPCLHAVEPALPRVGHHHDLFALAANLAIQLVFDSTQALFIDVNKAQHVSGKVPLRVNALVLFLKVNAFQIQCLDSFLFVGRHFARYPDEALRRSQSRFQNVAGDAQNL